jgi:ABC-type bacteriocin/lantibiotic exporter with double-glycine peptidase domain
MVVSGGAIILVVGGRAVLDGRMTVGSLLSFFAAAGLLRNYVLTLTGVIPQILEGREALGPLLRFFEEEGEEMHGDSGRGKDRGDFDGAVELEDVHFRYGERPLLEGVRLAIRPGEIVGLTGANGSGKSTIGYLIMGFYAPQSGRICAGGRPYEEWDLRHLRRSIGLVPQEPVLFPGTIAENIAYGQSGTGRERILRAADWASCREFIERLPQGFDTRFEDPGASLSGGELQKISIARAVAGRPCFFLLDEPTNHLDPGSICRFKQRLRALEPQPAVLLISQDRSALEGADRILELRDGRIVEGGTNAAEGESG